MAKPVPRRKKAPDFSDKVLAACTQTMRRLGSTWREWLLPVLLISSVTLWIYAPVLRGGFIWDDNWYISNNTLLRNSDGLWKFWFQPGSWLEYYPIEETVLWLQWQLWGSDPLGYHLTNVALHLVSALLIWKLLWKFRLPLGWMGGLLFAVHPVNVESVAWMVELKNTLSLPPLLLAMCAWVDYDERKETRDYWLAFGFFLVSMLCKLTPAPLPAVLLLYAWWKRGRLSWTDVRATAPFFVVTFLLMELSLGAGRTYASGVQLGPDEYLPLGGPLFRVALVGRAVTFYFTSILFPAARLMMIYPPWNMVPLTAGYFLPWLAMIVIAAGLWWKRTGWGRHALLGLGFFLFFLSPVLAFGFTFHPRESWVMDHFLYIPMIGLIGLVVAGLSGVYKSNSQVLRASIVGAVVLVAGLLAMRSHDYASVFQNEETLWTENLKGNPGSSLVHLDLGVVYLDQKNYSRAIQELRQACILKPASDEAHYNLGLALENTNQLGAAEQEYRTALQLNPGALQAYLNLGLMMKKAGKLPEAESIFRQGLKISPDDPSLTIDLAALLIETQRAPEAITLQQNALEKHPDVARLQYDVGVVLLQTGAVQEAAAHLEKTIELDPTLVGAHSNLGVIYARTGRLPEAIEQFQTALQLDPQVKNVRDNLVTALAQSGRISEAMEQAQGAVQADPNDARARDLLAKLQQITKAPAANTSP